MRERSNLLSPRRALRCEVKSFPLTERFRIAGHCYETFDTILVEITQGDFTGRGEGAPIGYFGQDAAGLEATVHSVRPLVEDGCSRDDLRQILPPDGARNAIDCALWDLEAQITGKPVWGMAGMSQPRPVMTTFTIGCDVPSAMAMSALRWSQARALKLKLCGDELDGERVAAVRQARADIWLGVDANCSLSVSSFRALYPVLTACNVALVEQPLPLGMEGAVLDLASRIPIYADESIQGLRDLQRAAGRFDGINVKLDKCGGLTEARMVITRARELGLSILLGNMGGSSLAMAPTIAIAELADHADLDGPIYLETDVAPSADYRDGYVTIPESLWGSRRDGYNDGTASARQDCPFGGGSSDIAPSHPQRNPAARNNR